MSTPAIYLKQIGLLCYLDISCYAKKFVFRRISFKPNLTLDNLQYCITQRLNKGLVMKSCPSQSKLTTLLEKIWYL